MPEGIPLDDSLYEMRLKKDTNITMNTDQVFKNDEDVVEKGDFSKKEDANELEISEMRPTDKTIIHTRNNEEQAIEIIIKEANSVQFKQRMYPKETRKSYPIKKGNIIYGNQDNQKETVDLYNSNQEKHEIPSSPYLTLVNNENEQNEETFKDSIYQANVKEIGAKGISDKLYFESEELNKNLRHNRQYSPVTTQKVPNAQPNKVSENVIAKIYEIPHKLQIGHEKYLRSQESGINPVYFIPKQPQISQPILENPIISHENKQSADVNQGGKEIENPNLSSFHIIDSEKDLDVPDGVEGPVPAVALPPPSNGRGYVAVPFNGKYI